MRKKDRESQNTKFAVLENHFVNTFFSGLYLSATEMIEIAKKLGITLQMNPREMVLKNLLTEVDKVHKLQELPPLINALIDDRVQQFHRLSLEYPNARIAVAALAQKANSSKTILARELRGNPYE
jgi:hypothetical protein